MNRIINLASTFCINYDESERFSVYPADAGASNLLQESMVGSVGELQVPWIGEGYERSVKVLGSASGMTMCDGVEPASTPSHPLPDYLTVWCDVSRPGRRHSNALAPHTYCVYFKTYGMYLVKQEGWMQWALH